MWHGFAFEYLRSAKLCAPIGAGGDKMRKVTAGVTPLARQGGVLARRARDRTHPDKNRQDVCATRQLAMKWTLYAITAACLLSPSVRNGFSAPITVRVVSEETGKPMAGLALLATLTNKRGFPEPNDRFVTSQDGHFTIPEARGRAPYLVVAPVTRPAGWVLCSDGADQQVFETKRIRKAGVLALGRCAPEREVALRSQYPARRGELTLFLRTAPPQTDAGNEQAQDVTLRFVDERTATPVGRLYVTYDLTRSLRESYPGDFHSLGQEVGGDGALTIHLPPDAPGNLSVNIVSRGWTQCINGSDRASYSVGAILEKGLVSLGKGNPRLDARLRGRFSSRPGELVIFVHQRSRKDSWHEFCAENPLMPPCWPGWFRRSPKN